MRIDETAEVLTKIAAYDRRKLGEADVRAWHAVISDVEKDDAMAAVERWYAEETNWMMPAHLRRIVRDIVRERASAAAKWAPGQYGVPKDEALPELTVTAWDPGAEVGRTVRVADLLEELGVRLRPGSRDALMPRRVAWEKEQNAYERHLHAVPNPHYRPQGSGCVGTWECRPETACPAAAHWWEQEGGLPSEAVAHYRPRGDVQTCMCSWMPFPHPYDPEGCVPGMIRPTEGAVGD